MYYWNYNYTRFQSNQEYDENNKPLYSEISDNQLQDFIYKAQTQNCQIVNGSDNKPMLKPIVLSDEQVLMNLRSQREEEIKDLKLWLDTYYARHEQKYRRLKTLGILTDEGKDPYNELINLYNEAEIKRARIQELERLLSDSTK